MQDQELEVNVNTRQIAAMDLGSNSFHLVVAKVVGNDIQIVSRHKHRVRLASGLDKQNNLDAASIQRGIDCLATFAERLSGFELEDVRIAGTHSLRVANNAHVFLQRAAQVLPFPIEIIPGTEEARLIYSGVTHTQVEMRKKLIIDIGGGSTEIVIGKELQPLLLNSLQMGCVSLTEKFFPQQQLTQSNFRAANVCAQQQLKQVKSKYKKLGWDVVIGSSGTIKAIREVLIGQGYEDGIITVKRLKDLITILCQFETISNIKLSKLTEERAPVFSGGVAILYTVMKELKIEEVHFSNSALREGILYEMDERLNRTDIRMRTTETLVQKYAVEVAHAECVKQTALALLGQYLKQANIKNKKELSQLLGWAALLHEVGLSINYQSYHKHSAYLLQHSYMPGFNREQQQVIATLSRFHRKTIKIAECPEFYLFRNKDIEILIRILRLAVVLNSQREEKMASATLLLKDDKWQILLPSDIEHSALLSAGLESESQCWKKVQWSLQVTTEAC